MLIQHVSMYQTVTNQEGYMVAEYFGGGGVKLETL